MAVERTLSIVKPDGVAKNLIGEVYRRFEKAGLRIDGAKMLRLRQDQAEAQRHEHVGPVQPPGGYGRNCGNEDRHRQAGCTPRWRPLGLHAGLAARVGC